MLQRMVQRAGTANAEGLALLKGIALNAGWLRGAPLGWRPTCRMADPWVYHIPTDKQA